MQGRHYYLAGIWVLMIILLENAHAGYADAQFNQQQQKALEQRFAPKAPDVSLSKPLSSPHRLIFPLESPCFVIKRLKLTGADAFPRWLRLKPLAEQANGRCMGAESINMLMSALQNRLTGHGWITSRVLAPSQDISLGELELVIMPGRVGQVRLSEDSEGGVSLTNALPIRSGDMLDLRAIEQGLENLQRLDTVQASVEISPGADPGYSDIIIKRNQSRLWRTSAWLDDAGHSKNGRYQSGAMLGLDNLLSLSDRFYVTAGSDLAFASDRNNNNYSLHYSLPLGYWQLSIGADSKNYKQTAATTLHEIVYEGELKSRSLQLGRLLHRNARQKTRLDYEVQVRSMRNYTNKGLVKAQKRNISAWKLTLGHREFIGAAVLDASLGYQQGMRRFGARPAPEESTGNGTALHKVYQLSAQLNAPFKLGNERFRYQAKYLRQYSRTALTPPDKFSLGNRWTVRGFNGELTLDADNGWYLSNTLAWRTPLPQQEIYVGIDYGRVGGNVLSKGPDKLVGNRLVGGVAGLRGNITSANVDYDLFAAKPLDKPENFKTDPLTLGFTLLWRY